MGALIVLTAFLLGLDSLWFWVGVVLLLTLFSSFREKTVLAGAAILLLLAPIFSTFERKTLEVGDAFLAELLSGGAPTLMSHTAIGTGSGGTAASTTLVSEISRVALDSTTQGIRADDNDVIYVTTFPAGTGTGAITEAGTFNAASSGTMLCYADFAVISKASGDTLIITWTITMGAS